MPKPSKKNPIISPTQARSKKTFERIIEATTYLIESRGLNGFASNEIAEVAEVNINSFYQYFLNKEAAVLAVTEKLLKSDEASYEKCLRSAVENQLKNQEALSYILSEMTAMMNKQKTLRKQILVNLAGIIGGARQQERRRLLAQNLLPFMPTKKFPTEESRLLAAQVIVHTFLSVSVGFLDGAIQQTERENIQQEIFKLIMSYTY